MLLLITPDYYDRFLDKLADMHRLRYRIFKERLEWSVKVSGDSEMDEFDALHPAYLLQSSATGQVQGCVRLLPTTGPTMLGKHFSTFLEGQDTPRNPRIWESSRFAIDVSPTAPKSAAGLSQATHELFSGMIEFGLWRDLRKIVTVTDARMERILRWADWPIERIGVPRQIGTTLAVAGYLDVSPESLERVRRAGNVKTPALWMPVVAAAPCPCNRFAT